MVLQGRTREQIRVAVGYNLGAIYVSSTSSAGGDATSVVDNTLRGGDDVFNGKWIVSVEGSNDGEITRVNDYVQSGTDMTVSPAFSATVPNSMSYEMWDVRYPPANIHEFINQAIIEATGRVYDPEEDLSLHGDNRTTRFDIPTEFNMLNAVAYRDYVKADLLTESDAEWTSAASTITQAVDTEFKKHGGASIKFTVPDGFSGAQELAHDDFSALDISEMTHIEYWIRCSIATTSGQLEIRLGEGSTQRELLAVPALAADTWTFIRTALTNFENNTAIDEVRIVYTSDIGACTIWADYFRAINDDHATYTTLPKHYWRIDKENRDLVLTGMAVQEIGHSLLRLRGGGIPVLLEADATATEIPDDYVIARATALALASVAGKNGPDAQQLQNDRDWWTAFAEQKRANLPFLENVREIS